MSRREKLFDISWRAAILILPWQTRWFSDVTLGGWPWEQGRWSAYVSWSLVVLTIMSASEFDLNRLKGQIRSRWGMLGAFLLLCSIAALILNGDAALRIRAISQWWFQILLLLIFVRALWRRRVPVNTLAAWFVFSLIPHIALGWWQYASQAVLPMKWLGIAGQSPWDLGVSVVQSGSLRVLRAYGGFPHPNVLGGWLAVGFLLSVRLATSSASKKRAAFWILLSALCSAALVISFARSAWMAAILGVIPLFIWKQPLRPARSFSMRYGVAAIVFSALCTGAVMFAQRQIVLTRFQTTERLEQKSIDARTQSLSDGWELFRAHPVIGSGPNAELIDLSALKTREQENTRTAEPLEPPHNAYLLALVDLGVVGFLILAYIAMLLYRKHPRLTPILLAVSILALLDHYLWSLWAGQTLFALVALIISSQQTQTPAEGSTA